MYHVWLFFHVRPANQPTMKSLCHKKLGAFDSSLCALYGKLPASNVYIYDIQIIYQV